MSESRPTKTYDERPKHPFGDCAKRDGLSSEGDRLTACSASVWTEIIMHRVAEEPTPSRVRVEASVRAQSSRLLEDGNSRHVGLTKAAFS